MTVTELIPVLQVAIGPVVLISGIGLLILSMTNRFGRVIDRGRSLARELPEIPRQDQIRVNEQLRILSRRAEYLRRAITSASVSVLSAAVLIITLFITAALGLEAAWLIGILFVAAMGFLIFSLVAFLQDLNESLLAFKLDIGMNPRDKFMK
ncbi:MAG: DUF2721 domain-containing protein [Chloroflexi bacterium]|nr:DUF2721 domain-containing protein [Chloroflexota bacterium]MBI3338908.1 DUF2721 domain-containing protein [Chloroflexota bacterium]